MHYLRRFVIALYLALGLLAVNCPAQAGTVSNASVVQLTPGKLVFGFVVANGVRTSIPACAANSPDRWVIDDSSPQGQAIAASIMTAFSMGKKIAVYGTGGCPSTQGDVEEVFYIVVYQ